MIFLLPFFLLQIYCSAVIALTDAEGEK